MTTYDYLTNRSTHTQGVGFPAKPIDYIGSTLYGTLTNRDIYASTDHGASWTYVCAEPTGSIVARRLIATTGGEVLLGALGGVWKSTGWGTGSVSWAQTLDVTADGTVATPESYMLEWGFDGSGDTFIATHYAPVPDWQDSRYAWISTDSGATWTQVWDSETDAPSASPEDSHIHAVCYDSWDDKFYLCEGHGDSLGVYVSANDGASWTEVEDNGLNSSATPTVAVATDDGIVFGTDNGNDGIWVLPRGSEAGGLLWVWEWESDYGLSLNGFANRGVRDPVTGIVYVGFQSDRADLGAVIGASDGVTAGGVWVDSEMEGEYANLAAYGGHVSGASDRGGGLNIYFGITFGDNMSGNGYWYTDATAGTGASAPDIAAYDTAGDIDVRLDFAPGAGAFTGARYAFSRYITTGIFRLGLSGAVPFGRIWNSLNGTENILGVSVATALGVGEGDRFHLRWQLDFGGNVTVYGRNVATAAANELDSDANWTVIDQDALTNTDLQEGTAPVRIGAIEAGFTSGLPGYYYRAIFIHGLNATDGTVQFDADFTTMTPAEVAAGAFVEDSVNAATVTFAGAGWTAQAETFPDDASTGTRLVLGLL